MSGWVKNSGKENGYSNLFGIGTAKKGKANATDLANEFSSCIEYTCNESSPNNPANQPPPATPAPVVVIDSSANNGWGQQQTGTDITDSSTYLGQPVASPAASDTVVVTGDNNSMQAPAAQVNKPTSVMSPLIWIGIAAVVLVSGYIGYNKLKKQYK